ncbi:MAG: ankyrin repeat domain-containing protein [Gallionella sp.]
MNEEQYQQMKTHRDYQLKVMQYAYHGDTPLLKACIKQGRVDPTFQDDLGNTALHYAASSQSMVDWSLEVQMNRMVNRFNRSRQMETIHLLLDAGFSLFVPNGYGEFPVHLAEKYGNCLNDKYGLENVIEFLNNKMIEVERTRLLTSASAKSVLGSYSHRRM